METERLQEKKEDILSHLGEYADTFYRLTILKVTQKAAQIASTMIVHIIMYIVGLFVLFLASMGAAWWVGDLIESRVAGFMIIAGFYFLLLLFIMVFRKKIIFPGIRNLIIKKIYE